MTSPLHDDAPTSAAIPEPVEHGPTLEVRGRLVRPVAVLWGAAALGLVVSEVVRLVDVGELGWQLAAGLLAAAVAWRLWHAGCCLDEHGLEVADLRGRRRILWSTLDAIEVDVARSLAVPVRARRQDGSLVALDGTWGMRREQRRVVADRLREWAAPHGVAVDVVSS